jgi:hypothetical protein
MDKGDQLITIIEALRQEMRYKQGEPIILNLVSLSADIEIDADTIKTLLPDAAQSVGLEISQSGAEMVILSKPKVKGRMRRPILGRR